MSLVKNKIGKKHLYMKIITFTSTLPKFLRYDNKYQKKNPPKKQQKQQQKNPESIRQHT